ncbi:aldo/keto reductase [Fictibacillus sp. Mic-4]|uniref:aldo/keto reductase n=1 Tax=Fictibacillus TaxID=1329200 RepID=UPI0003F9A1BD|nr:aldo/keto reductase [Fictibacillus gelatini]
MRKNRLGHSDLVVSEIGFGCMSLVKGKESFNQEMIQKAYEAGVNFFDTADLYQFGWNEEMVGSAVKDFRKYIILATKVGNRWTEGKEGWDWDPSKTHIKQAVKDSLHRLQTDYIDLYQLHGGTIEDRMDETIAAFDELMDEGVIRYYGISSIRPNVIRYYAEHSRIVSVMMQYSILDRRPEEEMLDYLHDKNISVIARGPVAKGWLSERALTRDDEDSYLNYSGKEIKDIVKQLQERFNSIPVNQIALKYALAHPAVAAVIPGASSIRQLTANIDASHVSPLTKEDVLWIQERTKADVYNAHRS